ncbi:MAG: sugar transferase [Anaerolineales bacterium]
MNSSLQATDNAMHSSLTLTQHGAPAQVRLRGKEWPFFIAGLLISDFVMIGLAFRLAYWIRFEVAIPVFEADVLSSRVYYEQLVMFLIPLWLVIFAMSGLYKRDNLLGGTEEYERVFRGSTFGMLTVVIAGFLQPQLIVARGWVLLAWISSFVLAIWGRMLLRRVAYRLRRNGFFLSPSLIIGVNREARLLSEQLQRWGTSGLALVGFIDDARPPGTEVAGDLAVIGDYDDLPDLIDRYGITELILASSALSQDRVLDMFRRFGMIDAVNLRMSSGLYEIITTGLSVREFAYVPLVGVNKVRLTGSDRMVKFALDYLVAIPTVVLLMPLLALLAILVKLDSPGSVLHRRRVMGMNGKQFDAFKFRTMHTNGDEILDSFPELRDELEAEGKLKADPRVTRLGRILRRLSLDELPQLLNVIRHEMSLVGPRMISPEEMKRYDEWGINLLTVLPGITGLWQVSGRSDLRYEDRVELDMHYIRNWTIWLDLQLLWQTIPAVLKRRGAY